MDDTTLLTFAALMVPVSWYLLYQHLQSKVREATTKVSYVTDQNTLLSTELQQERQLLAEQKDLSTKLDKEITVIQTQHWHLQERYQEQLQKTASDQSNFELLASQIIDKKAATFDQQHKEGIKEILEPLKERIQLFEQKVTASTRHSIEQHTSLRSQIHQLKELNQKITEEAANLSKALKGDNKVQGNWGELILESVLQKSGLEKDREYFVQQSLTDADGKLQRPDVIIALPDGKKMIIDSKVSLKAYESLVSTADAELYKSVAAAHLRSVKQHIDGLAAKNYHALYQMESPDFVLMFIPIDTAFSIAVGLDQDIYGYAFDKNIVIVTPSTLLATLKTVDTMWTNEKQHRHALEIAAEAGKMYDKLALLTNDLTDIGRRIDQTKDAYHESMKKLVHGKGNLLGRAEKVKSLGAKASKSISAPPTV